MGKVSPEVRERYNAKTYDKITFRLRKDGGDGVTADQLRESAKRNGASVNKFIVDAVADKI